ncbi:MAG: conjugal transfer protein TraC [Atopobiaceae bacterium]|nr:conjugal transfer protein TraC [Atopobiaceae bacterium]
MSRAKRGKTDEGDGQGRTPRPGGKPMGRRMREQERELSTSVAERRRHRRAARDVYNAIGFEAMYRDGICEVEEGLFSQTVSFSDISYQSARKDAQEAVFSAWCQLFDSFGADSSVQLSIVNTPIPADEIGNRTFFDESDPTTGRFAAEYNRILNDKMREGVSNLVRDRYLTFSVGATDAASAVPRLARVRGDVTQALQRIRCDVGLLDGEARLRVVNDLLRPGRRLDFDWGMVGAETGLRTKDLICPACIETKPGGSSTCLRVDDKWCQTLVVRSFGSELSDRCLAELIDLPIPLAVVLHVQGMDKARAISYVKQRLAWMDKEIIDEQMSAVKRGYDFEILPSELKYSKAEAEDLLDHLQNRNQRLFSYTGLVHTYADTPAELDDQVMQIMRAARSNSIDLDTLDYRQREGLNSVLPLGNNHVEVSRMMTTAQVAIQMPFATQEVNQAGGGYYGQNKESSNLVICNRKRLASPMGYVAGKPGSGKSFSVKREIENTILAYPEDQVIIFDPAGEYSPVVVPNGGTSIRLGPDSGAHLNPFDLADVAEQSPSAQRAFKIDAFLALSGATMAEGSQGLPEADKSIISRCVEEAYEACDARAATPTLQDLYDTLLAQPEREARDIALRYERYVRGATSFFNHESNVGFEDRVTNVDFRDLSQNMRVFGMLTALESVRNRMYSNFERGITTWLYIDEVQSLFEHPSIVSYFSKFWAEGRKFNLICTGITQNSVYMLEHEEARNMVLNSDFVLLHKQSPLDRKAWVDLLGLSEQESRYIDESVKPGEGLLVAGGARVPIKDDFPKGALYDLFNTKPDEVAEAKRAAASSARRRTR